MSTIFITKELAELKYSPPGNAIVVNLECIDDLIAELRAVKTTSIIIYDVTRTSEYPDQATIAVEDHINRTGTNPIIGRQNELSVDFTDLTQLYHIEGTGEVTHCVGPAFASTKMPYPTRRLCNIAILARALGVDRISAFLVNHTPGTKPARIS